MQALVGRYIAAYNAFDIEGMLAEGSKGLFAEREQRITRLEGQEGILVVGIAYRGRLAADIPGGPAAGTLIELNGRSEFSFADRRIVRIIDHS